MLYLQKQQYLSELTKKIIIHFDKFISSVITSTHCNSEDDSSMLFQVTLSLSDYVLASEEWHTGGEKREMREPLE